MDSGSSSEESTLSSLTRQDKSSFATRVHQRFANSTDDQGNNIQLKSSYNLIELSESALGSDLVQGKCHDAAHAPTSRPGNHTDVEARGKSSFIKPSSMKLAITYSINR